MMEQSREKGHVPDHRKREVYALIKVEGMDKDKWVRCGIGFVNRDESVTVLLDTVPVSGGKLIVRPWETREQKDARWAKHKGGADGGPGSKETFYSAPEGAEQPF